MQSIVPAHDIDGASLGRLCVPRPEHLARFCSLSQEELGDIFVEMIHFHGSRYSEIEKLMRTVALVESGLDVNGKINDPLFTLPLTIAAQNGCVLVSQYLLSKGADPDGRDNSDRTALFNAACEGQVKILRGCIDAGGNVNATTSNGNFPLRHSAIKIYGNRAKTVEPTREGFDLFIQERNSRFVGDNLDSRYFFLSEEDLALLSENDSVLRKGPFAVCRHNGKLIIYDDDESYDTTARMLISEGADINIHKRPDGPGVSLLFVLRYNLDCADNPEGFRRMQAFIDYIISLGAEE